VFAKMLWAEYTRLAEGNAANADEQWGSRRHHGTFMLLTLK
jgi:hypothetical protein